MRQYALCACTASTELRQPVTRIIQMDESGVKWITSVSVLSCLYCTLVSTAYVHAGGAVAGQPKQRKSSISGSSSITSCAARGMEKNFDARLLSIHEICTVEARVSRFMVRTHDATAIVCRNTCAAASMCIMQAVCTAHMCAYSDTEPCDNAGRSTPAVMSHRC